MRLALIFLAGLILHAGQVVAAPPAKPNIVLILADDLGYSDLGCYGGDIATPNLDALAKNGLRFTQFYNTARCWPSRGAILTGYYAQQIRRDSLKGVPRSGSGGIRPEWAPLLSAMLKPRGYRTYHSGKWHIDGKPLENAFDHSFEIGGGQNNYFKSAGVTADEKPIPQTDNYYVTVAAADHAIQCLREHSQSHADKPFFHYLCFTAPHFPLHALPEDIARYRDKYRPGWNVMSQARHERMTSLGIIHHPLPQMEQAVGPPYDFPDAFKKLGPGEINRPLPWTELTDAQREFQATKMAIHAAMVDRMDQEIGRVVEQLRTMGALDNTLIMFASDNGASAEIMVRGDGHDLQAPMGSAATYLCLGPGWSSSCNTPLRRHKTWVHEGGISTPLIAHWPAGIAARGELRHNPAHLIDVVPTVLEITGTTRPATVNNQPVPALPGKSLSPAFQTDNAVSRDYLWWLHEGNRALREGDWKIVAAGENSPWELYDVGHDRGEQHNLAETHPDKVQHLAAMWEKHTAMTRELALRDLPPADKTPAAPKKAKKQAN